MSTYVHRLKTVWQTAWLVLCFQLQVHFPPSHRLPLQIPVETERQGGNNDLVTNGKLGYFLAMFSLKIYFKMQFIPVMAKLSFQQPLAPVFSVT